MTAPDSFLDRPLTPDERDRALDAIARRIHQYRLETPAILFLEANRPLAGIVGLALFAATPLFGAFIGLENAERYASLLSDRAALDGLLDRLDRYRDAGKAAPKTPGPGKDPESGSVPETPPSASA